VIYREQKPDYVKKPKSFCIGQNNDLYILETIKNYFGSHHKIIKDKKTKNNVSHYRIYMYGPSIRYKLYNHFINYPLLGDKNRSFKEWISLDNKFKL